MRVATLKVVEGTLNNTSNPLDIAVEGDGFFQVTVTDGTMLTKMPRWSCPG